MRCSLSSLRVFVGAMLFAAAASGSELSQVLEKANHLIILNELGLTTEQITKIAPLCDQLVRAVQARDTERQRLLNEAAPVLTAARKALVAGQPIPPATAAALAKLEKDLETNDAKLEDNAVTIMAEIEKEFLPQQNRYIDWTPPKQPTTKGGTSMTALAQRQREQAALILATVQQLERIRTYPLERYILEAQKVVDDFLRPLIDPESPEYPRARDFMFRLVEQVRIMPEPEWQQRREQMAELLVGELGLLQPNDQSGEAKPYNWQTMYSIFSDLGAPALLASMKKARATTISQ